MNQKKIRKEQKKQRKTQNKNKKTTTTIHTQQRQQQMLQMLHETTTTPQGGHDNRAGTLFYDLLITFLMSFGYLWLLSTFTVFGYRSRKPQTAGLSYFFAFLSFSCTVCSLRFPLTFSLTFYTPYVLSS